MDLIENIVAFPVDLSALTFRDDRSLADYLGSLAGVHVEEIGRSREDRIMYGLCFGSGPAHISIIAGCHADEPVGPMTAQYLALLVAEHFPQFMETCTFHVVPQMNPDGANRNRPWFSDPLDLESYLASAWREVPGDDIEFGFGNDDKTRPESLAAQSFLRQAAPYRAHFSLHGMGFAEGAWCLLIPEWRERATPYMDALTRLYEMTGVPLHDVDRHGEKGFSRIREGFSTTPNSIAMKEFFLAKDDPEMAGRFQPSSMEWVQSLGGDPLCIVSELPLFLVGKRSESLEEPISKPLREELAAVRARISRGVPAETNETARRYELHPMPLETQVRVQVGMILLALALILES